MFCRVSVEVGLHHVSSVSFPASPESGDKSTEHHAPGDRLMTITTGPDHEPSTDLLAGFTDEQFELLDLYLGRTIFQADHFVLRAGERDRALYFLREGTVEIIVGQGDDDPVVNLLTAPNVFGEVSFFDGSPRSASVRSSTAGAMDRLSWESFEALGSIDPMLTTQLGTALGAVLARRIRQAELRTAAG